MESARDGRKVIFLDIDGVLQPKGQQDRFDHDMKVLPKQMAEKYHEDEYLSIGRHDLGAVLYDWHPDAVANLKKLIALSGAEKPTEGFLIIAAGCKIEVYSKIVFINVGDSLTGSIIGMT